MKSTLKAAGISLAASVMMSVSAHAVTLSNSGATAGSSPLTGFYENVAGGGLAVDGPANITFTYNGSGAGYNNAFLFDGSTLFTTYATSVGSTATGVATGSGLLAFSFLSNLIDPLANGAGSPNGYFMIAFQLVSATEANIFLNDNFPDFNFADMTINVKVSAVPLPAALPLLLAGLAGAAAVGRRRKKRTA
jgi:hypothetical protein